MYDRAFEWQYGDGRFEWQLELPRELYRYYEDRTRVYRFGVYLSDPYDDPLIDDLADSIEDIARREGFTPSETVGLAIRFVQQLPNTPDSVSTGYDDYPRYPIETLVDEGGDCEDTSILLAALLRDLSYGVVILEFDSHLALGVAGADDLSGGYYEIDGRRYYYLETTGIGWDIGEIPDRYDGASATVHRIHQNPALQHEWSVSADRRGNLEGSARVSNVGSGTAQDVTFKIRFADPTGHEVTEVGFHEESIDDGTWIEHELTGTVPIGRRLRPTARVGVEGILHDETTDAASRI